MKLAYTTYSTTLLLLCVMLLTQQTHASEFKPYLGFHTGIVDTDVNGLSQSEGLSEQSVYGALIGTRNKYFGVELEYNSEVDILEYQGETYSGDSLHLNLTVGGPITDVVYVYGLVTFSGQELEGGDRKMASTQDQSGSNGVTFGYGLGASIRLSQKFEVFGRYTFYNYDDALLKENSVRAEQSFSYDWNRAVVGLTWHWSR